MQHSRVRQAEIIFMLSLATDIGTGNPMEHAICSALVGVRFGEKLGLNEQQLREVYYAALLRHIGCTAEMDLTLLLLGDDPAAASQEWILLDPDKPLDMLPWMLRRVGSGQSLLGRIRTISQATALGQQQARAQCETGLMLAERLGFEPSVRELLWYIYERWDGKGDPNHIQGEAIPLPMRVVHIVQDGEQFRHARGLDGCIAILRQRAGSVYDPALVTTFCEAAAELYTQIDDENLWDAALAAEPGQQPYLTDEELDQSLLALADFIDLISPYYGGHSRRLSALLEIAATRYGLSVPDVKILQRAGLIHDLGKVGIPPGIWNKTGKLSSSEAEKMRLHPYYTERILARPPALASLGGVAATHHEYLDGSGYFRGLRGDALSPMARLMIAAHYYQARVETRPHRMPLTPEAVADDLRREVRAGRLDSDAVKAVLEAAGHRVAPVRRDRLAGLTEREIEILRLVARGHSARQLAQQLSLSERTVSNHITHIYEKINVSTRAAATLFAMQHHLLDDTVKNE